MVDDTPADRSTDDSIGKIYTMSEATERLRMSRRSLQDLIKAHPHYASNGSRKLFSEDDISKLWDAMRQPVRRAHPLFFQPATSSPPINYAAPGADPYADLRRKIPKRPPGTKRPRK